MKSQFRVRTALASLFVLSVFFLVARARAEDVTIYRDDFGIPHIFADSEESVAFGMGYAQAEDRLEELLKQYLRCTGRMSEAFGKQYFRDDYRQRLWQHAAISRAGYEQLSPNVRAMMEAYQQGIRL